MKLVASASILLKSSLPHRQLMKVEFRGQWTIDSSLPHRQLMKIQSPSGALFSCSLPHRQLMNQDEGEYATDTEFTAA